MIREDISPDGAIRSPFIFTIFFCLIFLFPQFIGSIPGLPEFARMTDFSSAVALGLYFFIRSLIRMPFSRAEIWLLVFLGGAFIISVAAGIIFSLIPRYLLVMSIEQALYPIRHVFLFAPALLAFILYPSPKLFERLGLLVAILGILFVFFMTYMYSLGVDWYDAHQGLTVNDLSRGFYFKRMGGIPGESGAYAFHGMFVWAFFLFFLFLNRRTGLGYLLFAMTPAWAFMIFATSQSRIVVLSALTFVGVSLFDRALFTRRNSVLISLMIGAILFGAFIAFQVFDADLPINRYVALRFEGILAGNFEASQLSSGRTENWLNVLNNWIYNPIFGYGYRNTADLLGIPAENFFIQGLADYGLIVFAILCVFLFKLWMLLSSAAPGNVPSSVAAAGGILRGFMVAAFVQWQVNDINTYWQTFPMMLAICVLFARHAMQESRVSAARRWAQTLSTSHYGSRGEATA